MSLAALMLYGMQSITYNPYEIDINDEKIINEMLYHYYGEDLIVLLMHLRRKTRSSIIAKEILKKTIICVKRLSFYHKDYCYLTYETYTKNNNYNGLFVMKMKELRKKGFKPIVRATYNCFTNRGIMNYYYDNDTQKLPLLIDHIDTNDKDYRLNNADNDEGNIDDANVSNNIASDNDESNNADDEDESNNCVSDNDESNESVRNEDESKNSDSDDDINEGMHTTSTMTKITDARIVIHYMQDFWDYNGCVGLKYNGVVE